MLLNFRILLSIFVRSTWKLQHYHVSRDANGTDNFRSKFASAYVFEDMICTFRNPPDKDADMDISQEDIRRIR
jgi:hypothetical protein